MLQHTVIMGLKFILLFATLIATVFVHSQEDAAVTRFREYLRINSAHPTPDYDGCIEWLRRQAADIGLPFSLEYYEPPDAFAVWMTWNGTNPQLKSILIDSHMDVVAVDPSKWDHDPFEAFKDENGTIFARGVIDMKSTTVAVLESIRRLKASGFNPLRTVHVLILPDEELYSRGVKAFVNSTTFANMNVGFALDEAIANSADEDELLITYAEKSVWQFNFTVYGTAVHASTMPEMTPGQKIQVVIDRLMEFRNLRPSKISDPGKNGFIQNMLDVTITRFSGRDTLNEDDKPDSEDPGIPYETDSEPE